MHPEEAEARQLGDQLQRKLALLEPLPDVRLDLFRDELAHGVADRALLVGKKGVEREEVARVELGLLCSRRHEPNRTDLARSAFRSYRFDWRFNHDQERVMAAIDESTTTGISFALTEEQKELRRLARSFAEREIRPHEAECDAEMRHPEELIAQAHELGLMNVHVPPEYGGLGLPAFEGLLIGEELYWGCSGIGTSITANGLGAGPVIRFGTAEQKARWLPPLVEQPILC